MVAAAVAAAVVEWCCLFGDGGVRDLGGCDRGGSRCVWWKYHQPNQVTYLATRKEVKTVSNVKIMVLSSALNLRAIFLMNPLPAGHFVAAFDAETGGHNVGAGSGGGLRFRGWKWWTKQMSRRTRAASRRWKMCSLENAE